MVIFLETLFSVDLVDLGDLEKHISVLVYLVSAAGENFWDFRVLKSSFLRENQYKQCLNTEIFACGAIWISLLKSQKGAKQGGYFYKGGGVFLQEIHLIGEFQQGWRAILVFLAFVRSTASHVCFSKVM